MGRPLPLEGVRIADFFWLIAGPLASRVFANFGAEVIRIESSYRYDRIRETGPHPPGPWSYNTDGSFNDCNTNKLSISLNLNHPKGVELARRIIAQCDVVTNNFTGDRMARWGLGYEDLVKIKPDIIMISMPVMGMDGPYSRYGGYGNNISAGAGLAGISGYPDRPPIGLGSLYPDFSSNPFHAVIALLAALHYRNRTGRGQFIELAQFESTIQLVGPAVLQYSATGQLPERLGNRHPDAAPHGVYPCRGEDRWIAIAAFTEGEWQALCRVAGHAEWREDARFATPEARRCHQDDLDAVLAAWTREQDGRELMARLQAAGVPAGVVQHVEDLVERDEQLRHRGFFFRLGHPEGCEFITFGEPIRLAGAQARRERAPIFGEHTEDVLRNLLGLSEDEMNDLYLDGVLS